MFSQAKELFKKKEIMDYSICRIDHLLKMKKRLVRKPIGNVNVKKLGMRRRRRNVLV
jgi:hypothetical protein